MSMFFENAMPFRVRRLLKVRMVRWPRSIKAVLFPNISSSSFMLPCTALRRVPRKFPFSSRCLMICRYFHPGSGRFFEGGLPFPEYSGTVPNTSLPDAAPAVRNDRRRAVGMPAFLELPKNGGGSLGLRFSESPRRPQAAVHVHHRRTEELPARLSFGMSFFFPPYSSHKTTGRQAGPG